MHSPVNPTSLLVETLHEWEGFSLIRFFFLSLVPFFVALIPLLISAAWRLFYAARPKQYIVLRSRLAKQGDRR